MVQNTFCEYISAWLNCKTEIQAFDPPLITCTRSTETLFAFYRNDLRAKTERLQRV